MEQAHRRPPFDGIVLSPLLLFSFLLFAESSVPSSTGDEAGTRLKLPTVYPTPRSLRARRPGAGFRIALFADLHYGENAWTDWGPAQDDKSDRVMANVLDAENPDFVVYLGDLVTANNIPIANVTAYWDRAISAARSRGLPWASVFGNHDDMPFEWPSEWFSAAGVPRLVCPASNSSSSAFVLDDCSFKGTTRVQLIAGEIDWNELSQSETGPKELWPSVSNYMLQVVSSKDLESVIAFLYFLDSGGGSYPEVISSSQARWFEQLSAQANPDSSIPELIFWHIPSIAYKKVAPWRIFGIPQPCVGSINKESVAAQVAEWGIMDILEKRPSAKAVFVGHNHGLDWCCPSKHLWLCFARHSGYGGYGDWPRGARIIEIGEEPFSLRSWIRMEDGSNHSYIELS